MPLKFDFSSGMMLNYIQEITGMYFRPYGVSERQPGFSDIFHVETEDDQR